MKSVNKYEGARPGGETSDPADGKTGRRIPPGWLRYAYFPFGGGQRICIGNNFAMMEPQLILATLAGRYRLSLAAGHTVKHEPLVTLRPRDGILMTLTEQG